VPAYEKSVFVNCPFDELYEPLFHAVVLAIAARGFVPRCALESEAEAEPRISRIIRGLLESKYSIHDLSRFKGEGPDNLARFNMPVELGIAIGIRAMSAGSPRTHNWLALVPPNFVHYRVVSDLAGYEVPAHDDQPPMVISAVAAWLSQQPDFISPTPTAQTILDALPVMAARLDKIKKDGLGRLVWPDIVKVAVGVAAEMPTVD
jgi:hypothetical protein